MTKCSENGRNDALNIHEFNATKARVLIQKLQSHIDKLNALRPKKTQATGLSSYSSIVHPVILKAENLLIELQVLVEIKLEEVNREAEKNRIKARTTAQIAPVPRTLELTIPTFNGDYEAYPDFKEAFDVNTNSSATNWEYNFALFRSKLGPLVRPHVATLQKS